MPQTTIESTASGDFSFTEIETSRKADDDSFNMQFTEEASSVKLSDSSAVDEWIWLTSLGSYTLSTSSKTPTEYFNASQVNASLITPGNNPIRTLNSSAIEYSKEWDLDSETKITLKNYSVASGNARGITGTVKGFCYSYSNPADTSNNNYGGDILIAVNHKQCKARMSFVAFRTSDGQGTSQNQTNTGEQIFLYVALKKFMN